MAKPLLAVLLCAVVLFVWGFVSWAVLPWHQMAGNEFSDEAEVSRVLGENAPVAGIYYLPFSEEDHVPGRAAAFANVLPNGFDPNMGKQMGLSFIAQLLSAALVALLLSATGGLGYWSRVGFVAAAGLTIGFVSHIQYWIWFGFSTAYTVVIVLDSSIAWSLAGLVMASLVTGRAGHAGGTSPYNGSSRSQAEHR